MAISQTKIDSSSAGAAPTRGAPPLLVPLDRRSSVPIFRQIYDAARQAILSGQVPPGARLPASRALAEEIGVARTTVVLAYEHLESEGYLIGRGSAGTLVADLPLKPRQRSAEAAIYKSPATPEFDLLSVRNAPTAFRLGEPALDLFPMQLWARLYARCARRTRSSLLGYNDPSGHLPLRQAIAEYVAVSRNVSTSAEQVVLVRGAQQAVDLAMRVLLRKGDQVWVEDPGYLAVRRLVQFAGAVPMGIPVDKDGLIVEAGIRRAPEARMACVAPSHHFPLGHTLSLSRRLALIEWAKRKKSWIIEDDFDSEFRYGGPPIASLQGLDNAGRVIYVGTFSKTLFPALRLGYLVLPAQLVDKVRAAQMTLDHLSPTLEQAVLTDFITEGHFTRHVRKMRAAYRERQQALVSAVESDLEDLVRVEPADTGMHVIGWLLRHRSNDIEISQAAWKKGIEARALSRYSMKVTLPPALVLGFAALKPREIVAGVRALRPVLLARGK